MVKGEIGKECLRLYRPRSYRSFDARTQTMVLRSLHSAHHQSAGTQMKHAVVWSQLSRVISEESY